MNESPPERFRERLRRAGRSPDGRREALLDEEAFEDREQRCIGGHDELRGGRSTVEAGDRRARLDSDERARDLVPRLQAALVVGVEAAGGDAAEVECGGADPPDVAEGPEEAPSTAACSMRREAV